MINMPNSESPFLISLQDEVESVPFLTYHWSSEYLRLYENYFTSEEQSILRELTSERFHLDEMSREQLSYGVLQYDRFTISL